MTAGPDGVRCRQFAEPTACQPRPPFDAGQQFDVQYWVAGEPVDGIAAWWVTPEGYRVWSGGTTERPNDAEWSATGDWRSQGRSGGLPLERNDRPGTEPGVRETEYAM